MGFVVMFVAAWLAIFMFYTLRKALSISENTFVYLAGLTLLIHVTWVIAEEFKLVAHTKEELLYAGFLINRSLTIPTLYMITMNMIFRAKKVFIKVLWVAALLGVLVGLHGISIFYEFVTYTKWNIAYDLLLHLLLVGIIYAALRLFRKTLYRRKSS